MLVLQTYQLHSFELANKKRFLRSAFCCCFPMAVNSTDGESGVLRSRQYSGADLGFREGGVGVEIGARAKRAPENFD